MYGVLVWPPEALEVFLAGLQAQLGVRGFGRPHLNLRQPFEWAYGEEALRRALKGILRGHAPFRLRLGGWGSFPGVIYLKASGGSAFRRLHRALEPLAPPLKEIEGPSYLPHFTLALDVPPERMDELLSSLPPPPLGSFTVREVALVEDSGEDLKELARFALAD
jgi:2'-5' RNA ligase